MSDYISPYLSGREKNFKIGVSSYTEDKTVLEVIGNVGIGTTNATSSLYVVGDEYVTGVVTATTFIGALTGTATTATYATSAGIATYAITAGVSTSVIGGIGSITQLNVSGVTTVGFITASNLYVAGVGTFLSSGLKIRNPANTFGYTITGGAIVADRILNLPVITATDTVATLGLNQTFSGTQTFNAITATGQVTLTSTGSNTLTLGASTQTGTITVGQATGSQTTNIQAGVTASGSTKTINFGTGGASGSFTQIDIGPTAGIGTVLVNTGTRLGIGSAIPTAALDIIGDARVSGVVTATTFIGDLTGTATTATKLQTARTFDITGDVVASAITFDGTGNVSLAATIQPNSVALGSDTTGDYVQSISGTSNQITVTGGTGEGSTPVISIPTSPTLQGNVTITSNLDVIGNITIGGTSSFIAANELRVNDKDIILGIATNVGGADVSTDTTANHGGIAIASTEGTPLIDITGGVGTDNIPNTYKQIMWLKSGSWTGLGTDAWLFNYGVGIGSTQVPNGVRLAVGGVHVTDDTVTATTFSGTATSTTNIPNLTGDVTSNNTVTTLATVNSNVGTYGNVGAIPSVTVNAKGLVTGVTTVALNDGQLSLGVSGIGLTGSATFTANQSGSSTFTVTSNATDVNTSSTIVARDASGNFSAGTITANLTGTATTATNLADAANITTGTINSSRLSGSYSIDIIGTATTATTATNLADAANITTGTINSSRLSGSYSIDIIGNADTAGVSTDVIGGIASVTQLSVSGVSSVGILTATSIGIGTTNPTVSLWVGGSGYFIGSVTSKNSFYVDGSLIGSGSISGVDIVGTGLSISGISTLGTVKISSGIVTATTGIITYYGDGRFLQGVVGFAVSLQDPISDPVYPMFASNTGVTSAGISTTQLVFIPSSGNLGVGSTQPEYKLTVQGDVKVSGIVSATTFYGSAAGLTNIPPAPGEINITDTSTNATYYPTFTVGTGYTTALNVTTTKFTFNPSTSVLTVKGNPYFGDTISSIALTNPLAVFTSNVDGYSQVQAQNLFAGGSSSASVDFVGTTDSGTDTAEYINMGINNSGFTDSGLWSAKDGYLFVQAPTSGNGGNLVVGTSGASGRDIIFHTGGTATTNERVRISDTKVTIQDNVEVTSGSIYGKMLAASYGMFMP